MNKKEILERIYSMRWYLGEWTVKNYETAINGIWDYRRRKKICGFVNAHHHIDRCNTFNKQFISPNMNLYETPDMPLKAKQKMVGRLHDSMAYAKENLEKRMDEFIEREIMAGVRETWAIVDTTPDIGDRAFRIAQKVRKKYRKQINMKIGCYPVFGFKDIFTNSDRYDLIAKLAPESDFLVGLPEKDEKDTRIGFKQHVSLLLELAYKNKKSLQIHADQANTAYSSDSFKIIECIESLTPEKLRWFTEGELPKIWLVHVISPSCYDGVKFSRLVKKLTKYNIGIIVCPRAALSMREPRSEYAPIHNSIARVVEFLSAGVKMLIGTDNTHDMFVPDGKGMIMDELDVLFDPIRNYGDYVFLKIGMGIQLNEGDIATVQKSIDAKEEAADRHKRMLDKICNQKPIFKY